MRMPRSAIVLAVTLLFAAPSPLTAAETLTKITVGKTTGGSGFHIPSYVAMNQGYYKAEGLDARFARHARTNALVHDWVRRAGFEFFAEEGFRSKTLTCVKNNKGIDVPELARKLREKHHLVIDPGYGKIRGKTFRLSNMGDETEETVAHLLSCLNDVL